MGEILLIACADGVVRNAGRGKHPSKNTPLYPPLSGGQVSTPQNRPYWGWESKIGRKNGKLNSPISSIAVGTGTSSACSGLVAEVVVSVFGNVLKPLGHV